MSTVQTQNLEPVPSQTPMLEDDPKLITPTWMRWFTNMRAKINVINASIVALAGNSGAGFLSSNGIGTITSRVLTPGSGITITNPDGVAGNPVISATASGGAPINIVNNTSTAYTVQATDLPSTSSSVGWIASAVGTANNIQIDTHANQALPIGAHLYVSEEGSGQTTIKALSGVTFVGPTIMASTKGVGEAVQIAIDTWHVFGNLAYQIFVTYDSTVLGNTPIAYWKLAETSGSVATDSSGNSYNATYINSPTLGATKLGSNLNTSVTFNGTSQYATLSTVPTALRLNSIGSFECWIKPSATPNGGRLLSGNYDGANDLPWEIGFSTSGVVGAGTGAYLFFGRYNAGWAGVATTTALVANTVYHIVGTISSGTWTLYVNGSSVGQTTGITAAGTLTTPIGIAARLTGASPSLYFAGSVSNCAIYGSALTATQVLAHYNAGI